jgi:hypothetical protein
MDERYYVSFLSEETGGYMGAHKIVRVGSAKEAVKQVASHLNTVDYAFLVPEDLSYLCDDDVLSHYRCVPVWWPFNITPPEWLLWFWH